MTGTVEQYRAAIGHFHFTCRCTTKRMLYCISCILLYKYPIFCECFKSMSMFGQRSLSRVSISYLYFQVINLLLSLIRGGGYGTDPYIIITDKLSSYCARPHTQNENKISLSIPVSDNTRASHSIQEKLV